MNLQERILSLLFTGQDNAVPLDYLIKATGAENRVIRKAIEQLRRSGTVIISDDKGYYFPAGLSELNHYIRKENARAISIQTTLKSARELERALLDNKNQESFLECKVLYE